MEMKEVKPRNTDELKSHAEREELGVLLAIQLDNWELLSRIINGKEEHKGRRS